LQDTGEAGLFIDLGIVTAPNLDKVDRKIAIVVIEENIDDALFRPILPDLGGRLRPLKIGGTKKFADFVRL